jgi:hypothetical protein
MAAGAVLESRMTLALRDARETDLDAVLALNNAAGPGILPMDVARLGFFWEQADYFRVAEIDGTLAGFLVALTHDAPHASSNFRWFRERLGEFLYVDRVVIASGQRSGGIGRVFYADVQGFAETRVPHLVAEVFLEESSHPALLFHGSFGFREVGQQVMAETGKRVAMLQKDLCSHGFVRETYGRQLPNVAWLQARALAPRLAARPTGT